MVTETHTPEFEALVQQMMRLSRAEQRYIAYNLLDEILEEPPYPAWVFMPSANPLSIQEMFEQGIIGSWADIPGDQDTVEWLNAQKAKRAEKYKW